jgi:hypothetical protein
MHLKIIVGGKVVDTIVSEFDDPICGYLMATLNAQSIGGRRSDRIARRQDLVKRPFEINLIIDGKVMQTSTGEFEDPLLTYLLDELGWEYPF